MSRTQMTDDQIIADLKTTFGVEFTGADVRGFCKSRGIAYQTVTKRLEQFKVGRGKWNLEVTQQKVEEIERTFQAPSVVPPIEQNLIPDKDDTFVKFGNFGDIKKLFSPVSFTLRSSRVFRVMVKRSRWSKRVLNLSVNSSA